MTGEVLTCAGPPELRAYPNRVAMGRAAAADVAAELRQRLAAQPVVRMVFAAAPSQQDMLDRTLTDLIGPACPATALRIHPRCILYLDRESASGVAEAFEH